MEGGYRVAPAQVRSVGSALAAEQTGPADLAATLDSARTADTGDPTLNGQVQKGVGDIAAGLRGLSAWLEQNAAILQKLSEGYPATDRVVADRLDQVGSQLVR
jgi:hypothetical protein